MSQQVFLREAKDKLGLPWKEFAERIGAPETTLKKWLAAPEAVGNYREMPSTVWVLVREILDHEALKNKFNRLANKASKSA
ncbi:transcriptional regulator [Undibacterium arcticum]|uniref:transcriptional regulator n=1 Tax=Undibacterium arcticum TaxID=1762892 RepID=UPI00361009DF